MDHTKTNIPPEHPKSVYIDPLLDILPPDEAEKKIKELFSRGHLAPPVASSIVALKVASCAAGIIVSGLDAPEEIAFATRACLATYTEIQSIGWSVMLTLQVRIGRGMIECPYQLVSDAIRFVGNLAEGRCRQRMRRALPGSDAWRRGEFIVLIKATDEMLSTREDSRVRMIERIAAEQIDDLPDMPTAAGA